MHSNGSNSSNFPGSVKSDAGLIGEDLRDDLVISVALLKLLYSGSNCLKNLDVNGVRSALNEIVFSETAPTAINRRLRIGIQIFEFKALHWRVSR